MLALERDIAYDIAGDNPGGRSEEEILKQEAEEDLIEKSGLTAMGVAVPEMLSREPAQAVPTEEDDDRRTPQGGIL